MSSPRTSTALVRSLAMVGVAMACVPRLGGHSAWAHDNVVVHRGLTVQSFAVLNNPFYTNDNVTDAREGSYDEDVPATRSLGHFYNPATDSAPWFALGAGPATQNCQYQWNDALSTYFNNQWSGTDGAFHHIGRALHFIQDMTSPAHTHDDDHMFGDDFESWGPSHFPAFDFSGVLPKYAHDLSPQGFVREVAQIIYDLTAYQTTIDEVSGGQPDCVLSRMFPSLHWDDGGFLGDAFWEIDRIGRYEDFFASDDWWVVDESKVEDNGGRNGSRRLRGNTYVENTGGNSGEPVPLVFDGAANTAGETMLEIYGRLMYPEAVAYGAGLLQLYAEAVGAPTRTATASITATATPTATAAPPTDTPTVGSPVPTATPTLAPTATPLCGATPRSNCARPATFGTSQLVIKSKGARSSLVWKWLNGAVWKTDFGDPAGGATSYALCIYDDIGGAPNLVMRPAAPAGGTCAGKPCWKSTNKGFSYSDREATPDGLARVQLKEGFPTAKIKVSGKGAALQLPGLPLRQQVKVTAQLVNTDGKCWTAEYSAPASRNDGGQFNDRGR